MKCGQPRRKNHEKLSLLPLLICFSGSCGVYPCPNDSRFDLNTSWTDGLARMKYSSWIWGFLATWMTWKGKKEMTRTWKGKDMKENEKIWKDVRENELKWKERQWQQTRLTPPKDEKSLLGPPLLIPHHFWASMGFSPCPSQLVLALLLSCPFQVKSQKGKTSVVCRFGEASNFRSWKDMKKKWKTWNKRNWMHM